MGGRHRLRRSLAVGALGRYPGSGSGNEGWRKRKVLIPVSTEFRDNFSSLTYQTEQIEHRSTRSDHQEQGSHRPLVVQHVVGLRCNGGQ